MTQKVFGKNYTIKSAIILALNEEDYIEYVIKSIYKDMDKIYIMLPLNLSWYYNKVNHDSTLQKIISIPDRDGKITVVLNNTCGKGAEAEMRNHLMNMDRGQSDLYFIIDGDEVFSKDLVKEVEREIRKYPQIDAFYLPQKIYFKRPDWVIAHGHSFSVTRTFIHFDTSRNRNIDESLFKTKVLKTQGVIHHFAYAKSQTKIAQKVADFSHSGLYKKNWIRDVFSKAMPKSHGNDGISDYSPLKSKYFYEDRISSAWNGIKEVPLNSLPEIMWRDKEFLKKWDFPRGGSK